MNQNFKTKKLSFQQILTTALKYHFLMKGLDPSHHVGTAIITAHGTRERETCSTQDRQMTVFQSLQVKR